MVLNWDTQDLICAMASPPGGAMRGIVRFTGPNTVAVSERIFHPRSPESQLSSTTRSTAFEGVLSLSLLKQQLPATLYLWPGNRSYTCQPMGELHTLGSPPLLQSVIDELVQAGSRIANPGEFTLRAFLGGRIDLAQVEAIREIIESENTHELQVALKQLAGGLSQPIQKKQRQILELCADLEAGLDFADEDIPLLKDEILLNNISQFQYEIRQLLKQLSLRNQSLPNYRVVLAGKPNAGKSSLFNALTRTSSALVSNLPGTTRDYLTSSLELEGTRVELIDTAGTETNFPTPSTGESVTVSRPFERAQQLGQQQVTDAHLVLFCIDAQQFRHPSESPTSNNQTGQTRLTVITKCDLYKGQPLPESIIQTSAVRKEGLDQLKKAIANQLDLSWKSSAESSISHIPNTMTPSTSSRCRGSLDKTLECLDRAHRIAKESRSDELIAMELRTALQHLGMIVGTVYTDDILDQVFRRFCIGK